MFLGLSIVGLSKLSQGIRREAGKALATNSRPGEAVRKRFSDAFRDDIIHSSDEAFRLGWGPALPTYEMLRG